MHRVAEESTMFSIMVKHVFNRSIPCDIALAASGGQEFESRFPIAFVYDDTGGDIESFGSKGGV